MRPSVFSLLLVLFCSCSKNSAADNDRELPVLNLLSPQPGQVFNAGETVQITGTISDNNKLVEIHVHISNNATGKLLIDIHRYPLSSNYSLAETFTAENGVQYKIQVIAKDQAANENQASVIISSS